MPQPNELLCIVNDTLPPTTYDTNLSTQLRYNIDFEFVNQNDVVVYRKDGLNLTLLNNLAFDTSGTYVIDESGTPSQVVFTTAPGGDELIITRMTDICNMLVVFEAGASIRAEDLNAACLQLLNLIQENYQFIKETVEKFGTLLTTPLYQTTPEVQDESSWTNERIPSGAAALEQLNATTSIVPLDASNYYDGKLWFQPSDTTQATAVQIEFLPGSSVNLSPAWPGGDDLDSTPDLTQTYDFDQNVSGTGTNLRVAVNITDSIVTQISIINGGEAWQVDDTAETGPIGVTNGTTNTGTIRLRATILNVAQGQSFFKIRDGGQWRTISANDPASNPFIPLQTLYVNNQGNDNNSGRTPGTAFATIKKAIFECNKLKGTASTLTFLTSGTPPEYNNTTATVSGIPAGHIRYTCTTATNLNNGDIVTIPQSIWSCTGGNENYPTSGATQFAAVVIPGEPNNLYIDVGPTPQAHTFVSTVSGNPGENNQIPVRQARVGDNFQIQVAPGSYDEMMPLVIYAKNLCISGSSLRNTYVHPRVVDGVQPDGSLYTVTSLGNVTDDQGKSIEIFDTECRTMFYCDSGTYVNNMTVCGIKAFYTRDVNGNVIRGGAASDDPDPTYGLPAVQGWIAALRPSDATLGSLVDGSVPSSYTNNIPGSFISKSPYIQNCTNFSDININNANFNPQFLTGEGGDTASGPTGGGILCDGSSPSAGSPLRSFVVDAFTQIALNGPGILCTNKGYSQLVSFFGTFCWYHAKALNGGQLNLSNCTTDFGQWGLIADQGDMSGGNTGENPYVFTGAIENAAVAATPPNNVEILNLTQAQWNNTNIIRNGINPGDIRLTATFSNAPQIGQTLRLSNLTFAEWDATAPTNPDQGDPDPTGTGAYVGNRIRVPSFGENDQFVINSVTAGSTPNEFVIDAPYKQATINLGSTNTYDTGAYTNTTTNGDQVYAGFIQNQNTGVASIQVPTAGTNAGVPSIFIRVDSLGNATDLWQTPRTPEPGPTQLICIKHNVSGTIIPVWYPILDAARVGNTDSFDLEIYSPYSSFDRRNLGLVYPVQVNDVCEFYLQSYISTGGHTFEFVGSGCDYDSHPDLGGEGNPANQVVELGGVLAPSSATAAKQAQINNITKFNQGRVWQSSTDEVGTFQVGDTFKVDQKTGLINIDPSVIVSPPIDINEDLDMKQWAITTSYGTDTNILLQPNGDGGLVISNTDSGRPSNGPSTSPIIGPILERNNSNDWNVVTQEDVGYDSNEVPVCGLLGQAAFMDTVQEIRLTDTAPTSTNVISMSLDGTDLVITLNDGSGTLKTYTLTQDP